MDLLLVLLRLTLLVFVATLVLVTLLPLSSSRRWWVRIWDFPRLHIALGFCLAVPLALLLLAWPLAPAVAAAAAVGALYQASWMYAFSPLVRTEVEFAADDPDAATFLAINVLQDNPRHDLVARLVEEVDPDVLLLMETDARWTEAMAATLARYSVVLREPRDDCYGMIFATRLPAREARILRLTHDETPAAFAELATPAGRPFLFVGLHPQPPTPDGDDADERDAQIVYAARFARRAELPLVAMGDFNEAAWSKGAQDFKRVGGYVDPRVGRGIFASFHAERMLIRCPIDQLYVTADIAVVSIALGPKVGSDHFPFIARLRFEPALAARLNRTPPPLDAGEIERLDELVAAYRSRLEGASLAAEAAKPPAAAVATAPS